MAQQLSVSFLVNMKCPPRLSGALYNDFITDSSVIGAAVPPDFFRDRPAGQGNKKSAVKGRLRAAISFLFSCEDNRTDGLNAAMNARLYL